MAHKCILTVWGPRDLTRHLEGDFSRYRGPGASNSSLVSGVPLHPVFDWSLIESNPHTAWRPRRAALQAGGGPSNTAQLGRPEAAGRPHRSGGCPGAPSARPLPTAPLPRAVGTRAGGGGAPRRPPAHVLVGDALAAAGASARTYPCGRDVGSGTPRRSKRPCPRWAPSSSPAAVLRNRLPLAYGPPRPTPTGAAVATPSGTAVAVATGGRVRRQRCARGARGVRAPPTPVRGPVGGRRPWRWRAPPRAARRRYPPPPPRCRSDLRPPHHCGSPCPRGGAPLVVRACGSLLAGPPRVDVGRRSSQRPLGHRRRPRRPATGTLAAAVRCRSWHRCPGGGRGHQRRQRWRRLRPCRMGGVRRPRRGVVAPHRHHCPWSTRQEGRLRSVTPPPADVGARAPWPLRRRRLPRPRSAPPRQRHRRRQRRPPPQW